MITQHFPLPACIVLVLDTVGFAHLVEDFSFAATEWKVVKEDDIGGTEFGIERIAHQYLVEMDQHLLPEAGFDTAAIVGIPLTKLPETVKKNSGKFPSGNPDEIEPCEP